MTPRALGDKRDKEFSAALYKLSFYASGTVDNLFATSSPIQGCPLILILRPLEKSSKISTYQLLFGD